MENMLVYWVGKAHDGNVQSRIRAKLHQDYHITDQDITEVENGFRFVWNDETHGDIELKFEIIGTMLKISILGDFSYEVCEIYRDIDSLFCDDNEDYDGQDAFGGGGVY